MKIRNTVLLASVLTVLTVPAWAISKCGSGNRVTCVVDGDTMWLRGEKIRMMNYDTPEPMTNICGGRREKQLAAKATKRLIQLLNNGPYTVERHGEDRYGRTLAIVRVDGINVGEILISEGLARRWPDGHEFWCE